MIDTFQLAVRTQGRIDRAMRGWLSGRPTDELALLNRLTEQLFAMGGCAIGSSPASIVLSRFHVLHRKGLGQTDLYGADLAVTLIIPSLGCRKTALFQLKKSAAHKLVLQRRQLEQARVWQPLLDRSWVVAADEYLRTVGIESVVNLVGVCGKTSRKTVRCSAWTSSFRWIYDWLECRAGLAGSARQDLIAEYLLRHFVEPEKVDDESRVGEFLSDIPRNWIPARAWAEVEVRSPAA